MKWLSLLIITSSLSGFGQLAPTIVSTEIIPEFASEDDNIYLVGRIGTPNYPAYYYGSTVDDFGDSIVVTACYGYGVFNSTDERQDTFNLGLKPAGYYQVLYKVHLSSWPVMDSCNYADSNFVFVPFEVGYASISESDHSNFKIYPNPTNERILKVDLKQEFEYFILNYFGQTVQKGRLVDGQIDVSDLDGQFILLIQNQSFSARRKIQINTP